MAFDRVEFDRNRLKNLVHYICYRADPARLGATKLNKILWFADSIHFVKHGVPLTGETYVKLQLGPVPRHVPAVIEELKEEGRLMVREPEVPYDPRLFLARAQPDLSSFTAEQISMVDRILHEICMKHTAASISEATHDAIWELAEMGEEIPYEASLASELGEVTEADIRWAREALAHARG